MLRKTIGLYNFSNTNQYKSLKRHGKIEIFTLVPAKKNYYYFIIKANTSIFNVT